MDYSVKLFKYRTAGVREYWIVNPIKQTVQTYSFEGREDAGHYSFEDEICGKVLEGFTVKVSELLENFE